MTTGDTQQGRLTQLGEDCRHHLVGRAHSLDLRCRKGHVAVESLVDHCRLAGGISGAGAAELAPHRLGDAGLEVEGGQQHDDGAAPRDRRGDPAAQAGWTDVG